MDQSSKLSWTTGPLRRSPSLRRLDGAVVTEDGHFRSRSVMESVLDFNNLTKGKGASLVTTTTKYHKSYKNGMTIQASGFVLEVTPEGHLVHSTKNSKTRL